jgi:hypothetical protein
VTPDRRSPRLPDRLYRFFCRRSWGVSWPLLLAVSIGGLFTALSGMAGFQGIPPAPVDGGITAVWVIGVAVTILVGLLAVVAGVSKLADPVARRIVSEHSRDPEAHSGLSAVPELKRQFEDAARRHAKLATAIAIVDERIKTGFANLPCKENRREACPRTPDESNDDGI